jgi:Mrp family chromosome partitioning ATPase
VLAPRESLRSGADALSVTWFGQVLRELERAYDVVIVDAPALLAVPDALIVAQEVETNIFLVSCDQTPRDAVQRGLATLSEMGITVHGLILNKVDARKPTNPLEGGYGYDDLVAKTRRALPARRAWLGLPPPVARGDHPLLASWHAWRRKGP